MLLIVYAFTLLGFWIRALRIKPENHPSVSEEDIYAWKALLIRAYKLYAILFFLMIVFSLGVSYLQNKVTRADPHAELSTSPLYFKLAIAGIVIYALGALIFIATKAFKHHRIGKNIGIYAA
ncbi:hypothetical protein N8865_02740 [Francisellaceae bacterium]|nr:hypothetical protein [Francisellaceae bacterium]